MFEDYLRRWPRGQFVGIAKASLTRLWAKKSTEPRLGEKWVNTKDSLTYVWIPAGEFIMGCSPGDGECFDNEKPAHPVRISQGFWIGQTEVTLGAYNLFARESGRAIAFGSGDQMPASAVNSDDASAYCKWIGGRLPTEAQWEYAARAGSQEVRYGQLDDIAWYKSNSEGRPHEVAGKQPNAFGLYDMIGNVWEWVADSYDPAYYSKGDRIDPAGPASGQLRVVRGASFGYVARYLRASNRGRYGPSFRYLDFGFRCLRE
ncbi:MAG: formylglycine-generating enzyme family protein [Acidobacteria bacterium]|nr:formylglycine-generating enzyme family protein [Acidobacteriota bacterium]